MMNKWESWYENDVTSYVVGPALCYLLAYVLTALPLEALIRMDFMKPYLIGYPENRPAAIAKTHTRVRY